MKNYKILKTVYKVSDFVSWQRFKSLVLSPSFQRRAVWESNAKSYLIDTIIRDLPMPIIFVREQKSDLSRLEPVREVVDGQQRIRTVFSFIDPSLLNDYRKERDYFTIKSTHDKELAGKTFSLLDDKIKQSILDYEFSVHVLPSQVDDREILQIFARMNSTGVKLNPQELRNAYYFGEFKTSMYQLASEQLQRWRDWKIFNEQRIARMEEVELSSEFAIVMLKGLTGKKQIAIDKTYKDKDENFPERNELERRFRIVMDTIDELFGNYISLSPFSTKILFYQLFIVIYALIFGLPQSKSSGVIFESNIKPKSIGNESISKIKLAGERIQNMTAPAEVLQALTRRTTDLDSRQKAFFYFIRTIES